MKHSPGRCPNCNSEHIDYGPSENYDNSIGFPFDCLDCGFVGEEIANVTFSHFEDDEGNEITEK